MKAVADPDQEAALVGLEDAIDALFDAGLRPKDPKDANRLIVRLEAAGNRVDAARTELLGEIDENMLYANDGHFSAKVMVRHKAKLSGKEAAARASVVKALRQLSEVQLAYAQGLIGTAQVRRIARLYANKRVREALIRDEAEFIRLAKHRSYKEFDLEATDWERLVDEDGTADKGEANHQNRKVQMHQEYNLGFQLKGRFGSLQGALNEEILDEFIEAELQADFAEARERLGEGVTITKSLLCRDDGQRSADALTKALVVARANMGNGGTVNFTTNLVLDHHTFEREINKALGVEVPPNDPWRPNFQSRTLSGRLIDTTEAVAAALLDGFRRAVVDGEGVIIDLGRKRKFVDGSRLAVQIMHSHCGWAGCEAPMTHCEIDHVTQWAERADGRGGGLTNPGNGGGMCAKHNRFKYRSGYSSYRDPDGRWHTMRPDGTEV